MDFVLYIHGLAQVCGDSIAKAVDLTQWYAKSLMFHFHYQIYMCLFELSHQYVML